MLGKSDFYHDSVLGLLYHVVRRLTYYLNFARDVAQWVQPGAMAVKTVITSWILLLTVESYHLNFA